MSGPYTTLSAEVAEMSRIHYQLEYTEGISQRMRIPDTIKVASGNPSESLQFQQPLPIHTTMMQVPERIIVAGEDKTHTTQHGELKVGLKSTHCLHFTYLTR